MKRKIDSYLGFAKKSKNLLTGFHTCMDGMKKGKVKLLILTEDLSENTAKKLRKVAEEKNVLVRVYGKSEEVSRITGSQDRGIFAISDANFTAVILKELDGD